jgi:hypothetical protein
LAHATRPVALRKRAEDDDLLDLGPVREQHARGTRPEQRRGLKIGKLC